MKSYLPFLREHRAPVRFGFAMTFFSSLGQTFFISLYVPHIIADLDITSGTFGTLYGAATIASSVLLINFGRRIDHQPLRPYIYKNIALLALSSLGFAAVFHPILLPLVLLGLRFSGQGLMSHISQTVMARHFSYNRGKALSLSSLGYSAGEMIFPILITALIPLIGWRISLTLNAALLGLFLLPLLHITPLEDYQAHATHKKAQTNWHILRTGAFWTIAPSAVLLSLTNTAVFFYQMIMAESRGWSLEWYSLMFTGYAVTRFATGLFGGPLVDRLSARRIFPLHLIPAVSGLAVLALVQHHWAGAYFLISTGVSVGMSGLVKSAVMAEVHGIKNLGAVRGVYTAISVLGTALGPILFGWFLDAGTGFTPLLLGAAGILTIAIVPSFRLYSQHHR